MITKNYTLSCYALEHPYQPYYCQAKEMIQLIDVNNDIYQFRLPDCEHYEKVQANLSVKQFFRVQNFTLLLYQNNHLHILRNEEAPTIIEHVCSVTVLKVQGGIYFLLQDDHEKKESLKRPQIRAVVLKYDLLLKMYLIRIMNWDLENMINFHVHLQLQPPTHDIKEISVIEYFFGSYCLLKNIFHGYSLAKLQLDRIEDNLEGKNIKYQLINVELPSTVEIVGSYEDTLLFYSESPFGKTEHTQHSLFFLDAKTNHLVSLPSFRLNAHKTEYLLLSKFLFILRGLQLFIFETVKGTEMAKINIMSLLQHFEEGSSVILGAQHQKQPRYTMLYDKVGSLNQHFYLMDKEKNALYLINIEELLNHSFRNKIRNTMKSIENDTEEIHQNVMKTLNFRMKKLKTLQEYISESIKTLNFGTIYRFLQNEQNIFVLSDGLYLFFNAMVSNLERVTKEHHLALELQKQILKLCLKIITQSKYEDHIAKALTIANTLLNDFRNKTKILNKNDNHEFYSKLLESKRVVKLLRQEKNKNLFELSYQLAVSVKGYNYLQDISKSSKQ